MEKITSTKELKNAIQLLEVERAISEGLLKEQFYLTIDRFRPINLIKKTLAEVASSQNLVSNIVSTAIGLGTGYVSRKIFVGTSGNIFKKLIGALLQMEVTNEVIRHPEKLKSLVELLFQRIFQRRK